MRRKCLYDHCIKPGHPIPFAPECDLAYLCLCSDYPVVGRPGLGNICDSTHQGVPKLISRAQYEAGGREAGSGR